MICFIGILAMVLVIALWKSDDPMAVLTAIIGAFIVLLVHMNATMNKPSALDVYRGRTTLQITYRDSMPVDTIVIFKDSEL